MIIVKKLPPILYTGNYILYYLIPCIFPVSHLLIANKNNPKNIEVPAIAAKIFIAPNDAKNEAINPAAIFAKKLLNIQTPIIREANLTGDNLETIDNPIGDRQSSPIVCIK